MAAVDADRSVRPSPPADACPYPRPFPPGFDRCIAYQPTPFIGLDTHNQPLPMIWTCLNLSAGFDASRGGHYPRCMLGDEDARRRWVDRLDDQLVKRMRELRRRFSEFSRPYLEEIWKEKAAQLRSGSGSVPGLLHELANEYLRAAGTFLQENSRELEDLGLPVPAASELLDVAVQSWLRSSSTAPVFEVPDQVLERFPTAGRLFLRPESA
jgi:hypothetical protein